jgi:hypothetical protein
MASVPRSERAVIIDSPKDGDVFRRSFTAFKVFEYDEITSHCASCCEGRRGSPALQRPQSRKSDPSWTDVLPRVALQRKQINMPAAIR